MYRKHQSALPANNLFLKHKWDIFDHQNHMHRVRTIKPCVDTRPPRTFMHLFINLKKLQAEQERMLEIQKENASLTSRVADIMRSKGYCDHKNEYEPKSLNCWKRQNEMLQLAYDNITHHRRLLDVHAEYNHNRFEDEYLIQQKYKAGILKYPANWKELVKEEEIMKKEIKKEFLKREKRIKEINALKTPKRNVYNATRTDNPGTFESPVTKPGD